MGSTTTSVSMWRGTQTDDWSGFVVTPLVVANFLSDEGWRGVLGVVLGSGISLIYAVQLLLVRRGRGGSWPTPLDRSLLLPTTVQVARVVLVVVAFGCVLTRSLVDVGSTAHGLASTSFSLVVGAIGVISLMDLQKSYGTRRARAQRAAG
ncbi:MAG: hypothetical protein ACRCZD_04585 [Phycicoccus sp.]